MKRDELSNHRGNVMTVISDKIAPIDTTSDGLWDYFNPSLVSATDYYPFGMGMPGRGVETNYYRFGFNTQERVNELSDDRNHTTAFFWEYDATLGRRWNLDPKPNPSNSQYSCLSNNPIYYVDYIGDTVSIGNLYDKNSEGKYLFSDKILAFEAFASTTEGEKYLKDHAQAGFSLHGVFMRTLKIAVEEEGVASSKGVDIEFNVSPITDEGYTDDRLGPDGRLKLTFHIGKMSSQINKISRETFLNDVDTYSHETLLHGYLKEMQYLNPNFSVKPFGHSLSTLRASKYNSVGLLILDQAQTLPIMININQVRYTYEFLWSNIMMPGLGYSKNPNIVK